MEPVTEVLMSVHHRPPAAQQDDHEQDHETLT